MQHVGSKLQVTLWVSAALLFTVTLLSMTFEAPQQREASWHESLFFGILTPFQKATTFVGRQVGDFVNHYIYLVNVSQENQLLKERQHELQAQVLLFDEVLEENKRLRNLVKFQGMKPWKTVPAQVIGHDPQAEFRLMTINRGAAAGLKKRMPVVSPEGLVGQIHRVGRRSAQVLLLTDPTSAVDARLQKTGARGLIRGRVTTTKWDRRYYISAMEYVDQLSVVPPGSTVMTSGLDGVFPGGIPIGVVRKVHENSYGIFKEAEILPLADAKTLREVLVITDEQN